MDIYVGHSSRIDYKRALYRPLKESELHERHNLVFPHKESEDLFDSKTFLREECDLMMAEASEPSTGLGIEIGWADLFEVPVICICREGSNPSSSLSAVTDMVAKYQDEKDLVETVRYLIKEIETIE